MTLCLPRAAAALPQTLLAGPPSWLGYADVVVVGSGIAGLTAALNLRRPGRRVQVITKAAIRTGSTPYAQGGIAAAMAEGDTADLHFTDTMVAGAGLCDGQAVQALVAEGPDAVRRLIGLGARFDTEADGTIALTREGGHLRRRILHAGGDATGAEISRALAVAVQAAEGIEVTEHAMALDLLHDASGRAAGLTVYVEGRGIGVLRCRAVVLASGGFGQVFAATTNPPECTGDGVALALRAGAYATDLEFIQFHPTVLYLGPGARGQQPLISEAVRGEGAVLVDAAGTRFMAGQHPLADLAPRDIVAKAVTRRMLASGAECMYLDGRELGEEQWRHRFPTILATCRSHGIDPVREPIPIRPAAHYASGGIRTDLSGRTGVPGLYACGETACVGVHGANRLASNSLLEGLVFAERVGRDLSAELPSPAEPVGVSSGTRPTAGLLDPATRPEVQRLMTRGAGVLRSEESLRATREELSALAAFTTTEPSLAAWETTNLHLTATALTAAALERCETRGSHWREDHPATDNQRWGGHLSSSMHGGTVAAAYQTAATLAKSA